MSGPSAPGVRPISPECGAQKAITEPHEDPVSPHWRRDLYKDPSDLHCTRGTSFFRGIHLFSPKEFKTLIRCQDRTISDTEKGCGVAMQFMQGDLLANRPSRGSKTPQTTGAVSNGALQGSHFATTSKRKTNGNRTPARLFQGPSWNDAPINEPFGSDAPIIEPFGSDAPNDAPLDAPINEPTGSASPISKPLRGPPAPSRQPYPKGVLAE